MSLEMQLIYQFDIFDDRAGGINKVRELVQQSGDKIVHFVIT